MKRTKENKLAKQVSEWKAIRTIVKFEEGEDTPREKYQQYIKTVIELYERQYGVPFFYHTFMEGNIDGKRYGKKVLERQGRE